MAYSNRLGITELSEGKGASGDGEPTVTVIFVHGLRGHPVKTWEHAGESTAPVESAHRGRTLGLLRDLVSSERSRSRNHESTNPEDTEPVYWPRDLLPTAIPSARILTYGYDADVIGLFQARSKDSISQHAQTMLIDVEHEVRDGKPIIFVAHSLGGILVKDVLRRSKASLIEKYRSVHAQTRCIVFLGTPHQGAAIAGWGEIARNVAAVSMMDSNKRILSSLEPDSEVLDNIQSEFMSMLHTDGFKVHSFQEAQGVSGVKGVHGKVVDDFSSKLGNPAYEVVESIDANHMAMARFTGAQDPGYRRVSRALRDFVEDIQQESSSYTSFPRLSFDEGRPHMSKGRLSSGSLGVEELQRMSLGTSARADADRQLLHPSISTPGVQTSRDQAPNDTERPSSRQEQSRVKTMNEAFAGDSNHGEMGGSPNKITESATAPTSTSLSTPIPTRRQSQPSSKPESSVDADLPLHTAIGAERSATVVSWLINHGADVNASSLNDNLLYGIRGPVTPLHIAAHLGLVDICKILLDAGANLQACNSLNRTPLHLAARSGQVAVCKLLIDVGADVHALTGNGSTPLHLAAQNGHATTCICLLNAGAVVDTPNSGGQTALHFAHGHIDTVKMLLGAGADTNAIDSEGSTPLHYATRYANVQVLQLLLHVGANPNLRDAQGRAPLHISCAEDRPVTAKALSEALLEAGANPDLERLAYTADGHSTYPLHLAQRSSMVELLLKHGATVSLPAKYEDGRCYTPLMRMAQHKRLERFKMVLKASSIADIELELDGQTALGIAKEKADKSALDSDGRRRYEKIVTLIEKRLRGGPDS